MQEGMKKNMEKMPEGFKYLLFQQTDNFLKTVLDKITVTKEKQKIKIGDAARPLSGPFPYMEMVVAHVDEKSGMIQLNCSYKSKEGKTMLQTVTVPEKEVFTDRDFKKALAKVKAEHPELNTDYRFSKS